MFENVIYFIFISYYIKKKLSRAGKMGELARLVRGLIGVGQKKKFDFKWTTKITKPTL